MNNFFILINIDKTLFSRATNCTHSWLPKRKEWIINNISYSNSWSLITSIASTESAYAFRYSCSFTEEIFADFLKALKSFIQDEMKSNPNDWLILMDNASIHRSKIVKDTIHQEKLKIAFIPTYSPDLALIEKYFSLLKLIVIKVTQGSLVNLKSKNSFNNPQINTKYFNGNSYSHLEIPHAWTSKYCWSSL